MVNEKSLEQVLERAKEDIEDLQTYIEELASFLPLAICSLNPNGTIIDVNKAFEKLSGFGAMEIIGKSLNTLFLEKKEIQGILDTIEQKRNVYGKELTLLLKSKEQIPVSVSFSSRIDKEGTLIGSFVAITDISQLKELQENLEKKVKERTKELQERIDEMEKFHKLTVGRELKMMELKKEIEQLKKELEKYKPT